MPLWVLSVALSWAPALGHAQDFELISAEGQKAILGEPTSPSEGSSAPQVTVVEYFDYNCPYCKRLVPTLQALLASDHTIALVYKDWPILGAESVYAAHCALAAKWQDKYLQAHDALISGPRLASNEQVDALLQRAGIDMPRLKADMDRHSGTIDALLEHDNAEARALGLRGTPGILVGRQLLPGVADLPTLKKLVANARNP